MPLTDAKCRSAQPGPRLQKLTDGGGLQLWLQPTGARLWRFAYRFAGKQKLLALGVYPTVPLARARQAREDAKRLLADGLDPALEKKRQAQARADAPTFRHIAAEYVAKLRREKRSEATMAKVEWLLGFANAAFGDEPIRQIAAPAILKSPAISRSSREIRVGSAASVNDRQRIQIRDRHRPCRNRPDLRPPGRFDASQGNAACGDHGRQEIWRPAARHRRIRWAAKHADRIAIARALVSPTRRIALG